MQDAATLTATTKILVNDASNLATLADAGAIPEQEACTLVTAVRERDMVTHGRVHNRLQLEPGNQPLLDQRPW